MDIWIEILHAIGEDATAALGFTVLQDFEGDHFTFSKFPPEDLFEQFGLEVRELALYDSIEGHIVEQTTRGRMVILEADGFALPDTRGMSYRVEHTKTTIAINRIDPERREIDYFHGPGFYSLSGADYDAVVGLGQEDDETLFPYAEFVKLDRRRRLDAATSLLLLRRHLSRRPTRNPVAAFRERLHDQVEHAAGRSQGYLHRFAFNTARQLGMNFELLASHLRWLEEKGAGWAHLSKTSEACLALSTGAKTFQFQLARAVTRKRFGKLEESLDPLVAAYDTVFDGLSRI